MLTTTEWLIGIGVVAWFTAIFFLKTRNNPSIGPVHTVAFAAFCAAWLWFVRFYM